MKSDELTHYASPYYDPVKAHEYYMRTRELKGRHSTSKWTDTQKQAWAYAKNQIREEKKAKKEVVRTDRDNTIETDRTRCQESIERISALLEERLAKIASDAAEEKEKYSTKKIPKGLTKGQTAYYRQKFAEERAKIANDAEGKKNAEKNSSQSSKTKLRSDLKSTIASTRENFKKRIEEIDKEYETILDNEYSNIKNKVR